MSQTCQRCAASNAEAARFCRQCGAALPELRVQSLTRITMLLARWRKLSRSVTRQELRSLLGEPRRIESDSPASRDPVETWVYEYESADTPAQRVCGRVTVSSSGSHVVAWCEPDWDRLREGPA
ncbi:MAG: hypothetical protein CHACPFDD_03383 [Phycisphaerae bacterium]|nr:hypothetical protein [Phycisphaerae bacterium]